MICVHKNITVFDLLFSATHVGTNDGDRKRKYRTLFGIGTGNQYTLYQQWPNHGSSLLKLVRREYFYKRKKKLSIVMLKYIFDNVTRVVIKNIIFK